LKTRLNLCCSLLAAIFTMVSFGCDKNRSESTPVITDTLRIGLVKDMNHLFLLADIEGNFAQQNLCVDMQFCATGEDALAALERNEVDMAVCGLGPFTQLSFRRENVRIIASLVTYRELYEVAANRTCGITTPSDLRYKRVGVSRSSSMHFFLDNFLLEHDLPADSIMLSYIEPEQQVDSLVSGSVAAICTREPYLGEAEDRLGNNLIRFRPSTLPANVLNLITMDGAVPTPAQERLLRALLRAEQSIQQNPMESSQKLAALMGVPAADIVESWQKEVDHRITLSQNLLLNLENVAIWQKWRTNDRTPLPNYLEYIDVTALRHVKPDAVSLISEERP